MAHENPYKQTVHPPNWMIYLLKGVLIAVFIWQFALQIPDDYWERQSNEEATAAIETIEYSQLLGTTTPVNPHFLQWGDQTIHHLAPSQEFSAPFYELSKGKIKDLTDANWQLLYKGYPLDIVKVSAIFLTKEKLPIICEDASADCVRDHLPQMTSDFELWLSLETKEQKPYFTKIRVGNPNIQNVAAIAEANAFWEKLIKKDKFKEIDNLQVAKPVFRNNQYVFKWGDWERYVDQNNSEPRIKVDTATFKNWLRHHQPSLYREGEFVPFQFSVGFWDRRRWDRNCYFERKEQQSSLLETYPCLERLRKEATVGDVISIFLYQEEDFLAQITNNRFANNTTSFILNGRQVRLYIPIILVEQPISTEGRSLQLSTSQFTFQLNNATSDAAIKMDTLAIENENLLAHYKNSQSAEIVHIPNFKTIRRIFTQADRFIEPTEINETITLSKKVYAVHTFPEFYDFGIFPPTINSRGLSTVLDKTTYLLKDYIGYRNPFTIKIGSEKVKLLQTNITIIPKHGEIIRYVTDNPEHHDIQRKLDNLSPETSIYFDDILFERTNGEQLAFPLAVGLHLK